MDKEGSADEVAPFLQLVSISATTSVRSDAPADHAQYQGWNIEEIPPLQSDLICLFYMPM